MQKILMLLFLLNVFIKDYAQTNPILVNNIDSVKINNLKTLLTDKEAPSSSFVFAMSIGNTLFENRNSAIKSKTFVNNTVIYSPSISYFNKSGLSLEVQAYYLKDGTSGLGISQYSITPGFELQGNKEIEFSVAFAHYIVSDIYSDYASPIQNDFYTSLMYKKSWLRPGVAIDYSAGTFHEVQRQSNLYDSTTNKLKSFSFIPSVSHEFNLSKTLNIDNDLLFTPTLMLNTGNSYTAIKHKTNMVNSASVFSRKKGKLTKFENTKFQPESIGLNLDLIYAINKFTFTSQIYFDYTIPKTDLDKLATIFNLNISYSL